MSTGPSRRSVPGSLGLLPGCPFAARARDGSSLPDPDQHVTDSPALAPDPRLSIPWLGAHQAGIITPRPGPSRIFCSA